VQLSFDLMPIKNVAEFLSNATPLKHAVVAEDLPPDLGPITMQYEGTLGRALDVICWLADMSWKVEGDTVTILRPEEQKNEAEADEEAAEQEVDDRLQRDFRQEDF
jgi:hypothetical protein